MYLSEHVGTKGCSDNWNVCITEIVIKYAVRNEWEWSEKELGKDVLTSVVIDVTDGSVDYGSGKEHML